MRAVVTDPVCTAAGDAERPGGYGSVGSPRAVRSGAVRTPIDGTAFPRA